MASKHKGGERARATVAAFRCSLAPVQCPPSRAAWLAGSGPTAATVRVFTQEERHFSCGTFGARCNAVTLHEGRRIEAS